MVKFDASTGGACVRVRNGLKAWSDARMMTLAGGIPPSPRGRLVRMVEFVRPYAVAFAGAFYLFSVGWTRWRHRGMIVELAARFGYSHGSREPAELPRVAMDEIVRPGTPIDLRSVAAEPGNVTTEELVAICGLVRLAAPRCVFEFGTFNGRTTLNLAANAPPGSRVYTLDLPRSGISHTAGGLHPHEIQFVDKDASGQRLHGSGLEGAIVQLQGDSGTFDFKPYRGAVDLVFVDASHAYEYVINDSLQALYMVSEAEGVIIWHDYSRWDGVTRALNQLRRLHPQCAGLQWIDGTTLALLRVSRGGRMAS